MRVAIAVVLGLLLATPGWAVLGEREPSVTADQQRLRGELRSAARQGYTLHEIDSPNGMTVKEYVGAGGVVFGLSWQGPTIPDLRNLLGTYFPEFQQSAGNAVLPQRRAIAVRTERLVVESAGHLRAFHGRAYVPSLFPAGLSERVVQ